jgi:glycosyltransferase involved in cell wall biosynthesis
VVVPKIYGIPEVVEDDVTGYHYAVGNVKHLAQQIRRCFADPARAKAVGVAAERRVRPLFDAREMIARIERLYERVLVT